MKRRTRALGGLVVVVALLGWTGCGPVCISQVTPVTCTVIYKGKPVEGATVAYIPAMNARGKTVEGAAAAVGVTDALGKATLRAFPERLGAQPGDYGVVIQKIRDDLVTEDGRHFPQPVRSLIPAKYADYRTSGLTATVGDEPLVVTYELTD